MLHLDGKTAFITGGASGIGLAMAKVFLRNGMKVAIGDLMQDRLDAAVAELAGAGSALHALRLDVTDRPAVARAADEVERVFGRVHVLCNNAGVGGAVPMDVATYEDWDWVLGVNLFGVINTLASFLPKLKKHGEGGHVVNTASMAAMLPLPAWGGIYTTSKFAVLGLSGSLRQTLAPCGIGVSVLCPGLVETRIGESEQTRPRHLTPRERPASSTADASQAAPPPMSGGMDPLEVAERVLQAIRHDRPYVLTHGEFEPVLRAHFDAIIAAFAPRG